MGVENGKCYSALQPDYLALVLTIFFFDYLDGLFPPRDAASLDGGFTVKPNEDSLDEKIHSQMQLCLVPCPGNNYL